MDPSSALASINWLAVLVASLSMFVLGALWYGPLFGTRWQALVGLSDEELKEANMARIFGTSFVLELVAAAVLALFIGPDAGLAFGLAAGGAVGLFWVGTAIGTTYLFERRSFLHWFIDAGYWIVGFLVMGGILGAWS